MLVGREAQEKEATRDWVFVSMPEGADDRRGCCTAPRLCRRCREDVREEAMDWLRDLSDDVFQTMDIDDIQVVISPSSGWLSPGAQRFSG